MKLLGIVILYYPDDEVVKNIATYLPFLDCLMLWENTPAPYSKRLDLTPLGDDRKNILTEGKGINVGIGYALNKAVAYARENGFTHLLTLDQDSYFSSHDCGRYLQAIRNYGEDKSAIFSTNYFIKSQQTSMYPQAASVDEVSSAMTSGSIYPLALFDSVGEFMERLFVWGVDCEFCWRARGKGISTLCFKDILLVHDLGYQKKKRRLLGKEVFPNEYGPARSYYNVRNGILLHRLYPKELNLKSHLRYHFFKRIVFILLYEKEKSAKLKALFCGYYDGLRGKTGEWKMSDYII
ncbi:glycosyl transferase family 2 [Bacteroides oleiciplenus]|uniref:glycosyl transferase family 2 n=1 Tax=Bacteroides oleiciplenus TaxID=626931 RepID=UPI0026DC3D7B|nr:glycosyl transferase family 2 [Bacteroides oleiciplenus]